ncbi:hypothetical protein EG328_008565 [Venturia inaequalis]|uniref:Uncharacterized protein n=1 Tax=Venturia inaequalis TaxID=5025 RepID=A0A8H3Z8P5_VENIN|nr:hypothetical protein EG328_008565 [Venturia inaequalis]KAE9988135.1 hypothetical protein EG327_003494 [Venturia inaequalis]RDI88600.1 Zuotin [Venturia inaequalis]
MRLLAAIVCSITCATTAYARPDGSDVSVVKSGPHVESSHSESPSLVAPAAPSNSPWDLGAGTSHNTSSSSSPANPKAASKPQQSSPGANTSPANGSPSGGLASGHKVGGETTTSELPKEQLADEGVIPNLLALEGSLLQIDNNRDSQARPTPSLVAGAPPVPATTPEIYEVPGPDEPQPKVAKGAPPLPMAMVHSEAALDGPHTMKPGDSILNAGVDPFASSLLLGMGQGGAAAALATMRPTHVVPAVQGATFAAGGTTYTASIDKDFNVVVASTILKPGGAAATLAGGAAKVSVMPGGALIVDGETLTMSALHPLVTGCVVNINGHLVTAKETGTDHQVMVISTATLTVGGPAATLDGQQVSLGPLGLHLGPSSVAAISTMTPPLPEITSMPFDPLEFLAGLARASQSANAAAKPTPTSKPDKTGAGTRQFSLGNNLVVSLGIMIGMILIGG